MLSSAVKTAIRQVSTDKHVQLSCLRAMFQECERGTDLWEWLEGDRETFQAQTRLLLWGTASDEEEEDEPEEQGLYGESNPHQVISYLLDQVEEQVSNRLG